MARTEGSRQLARWLKESGTTQKDLATRLKVTATTVSRWAGGVLRPEHVHREALRQLTGTEIESWLTAAERKLLDGLHAAPIPAAEPVAAET